MSAKAKDRRIAALLAFASAIPVPFFPSGLHKFYLGQSRWGVVYLLLSLTPIPRFASVLEGIWYLFQEPEEFDGHFNQFAALPNQNASAQRASQRTSSPHGVQPKEVETIAEALRQLDQLRQDGLVSEYEFEQKRRQLLDQI
jgi:TM2 domain-containing membrane protein YozV